MFLSPFSHVLHAAKNPIDLDDRQAEAVAVRIELDLRIGYAFTRFQTNNLRPLGASLSDKTISFGE
jgi:DNA topoisomerase III